MKIPRFFRLPFLSHRMAASEGLQIQDLTLSAREGNDQITSKGDLDIIDGGDDADNIDAGGGDDLFTGGKGADYLRGGLGNDTYTYVGADYGADLISDSQGSNKIHFEGAQLGSAGYDASKLACVGANVVEICKYTLGSTDFLLASRRAA